MKATKVEIVRDSVVKIVPILAGKGIDVTQIGIRAFVQYDSKTKKPLRVNIPFIPDNASDELLIAIQGFIDHEVAHLLYSDPKYVQSAMSAKVEGLYGIIEDTYIERKMKAAYRGSKANLIQTWQFVQDRLVKPAVEKAIASGSEEQVFGALLVPLMRLQSGQKECEPFVKEHLHRIQKFVDAIGPDLFAQLPKVNSSEDGFKLAVAMHNRIEELKRRVEREREERRPKPPAPKPDKPKSLDDSPDELMGDPDGDPEAGDDSGPSGESEVEVEVEIETDGKSESDSDEDEKDGEGSSDADTDPEGGEADEEGEEGDVGGDETSDDPDEEDASYGDSTDEENEVEEIESDEDEASESEADLDEAAALATDLEKAFKEAKDLDKMMDKMIGDELLDSLKSTGYVPLTKDFDVIEEFKPSVSQDHQTALLEQMEENVSHCIAPLQRHLERCVAAKSHSRMIPGHRSGRINPTALHRIVTGDERLFRRKHISKTKDAAISLVVDLSGSMCGHKVDLAMQTAFAMSVSLDRLNITHEVIGFTTNNLPTRGEDGRRVREALEEMRRVRMPSRMEPVYMPIFKGFNSKLTVDRKRAIASYDEIPLRNNTDGEAIEYAARRLASRRETRKIMIVLSDGSPCAGAGDYVEQAWHLKQTVKRLNGAGFEMFGIGIQDDSVREFYPKHAVLHNLADLPVTVMQALEKMLLDQAHAA